MIIRLLLSLAAFVLVAPLAAQDSMPPAPYAYVQLDDPQQEARTVFEADAILVVTLVGNILQELIK